MKQGIYVDIEKEYPFAYPGAKFKHIGVRASSVLVLKCGHATTKKTGGSTSTGGPLKALCLVCTKTAQLEVANEKAQRAVTATPAPASSNFETASALRDLTTLVGELRQQVAAMAMPKTTKPQTGARAVKMHKGKLENAQKTACGRPAPATLITDNVDAVTCKLCLSLMVDGRPLGMTRPVGKAIP